MKSLAHITDLKMEAWIAAGGFEVPEVTGHQIVETDDLEAFSEKTIDEVRADESSRSSDKDSAARRSESHVRVGHSIERLAATPSLT